MDDLALEIVEKAKTSNFSFQSIKEFITLINTKKNKYADLSFYRSEPYVLVLKAKWNETDQVALKVVEWKGDESELEEMKRRYTTLQQLSYSGCFVEIKSQFFLAEEKVEKKDETDTTSNSSNMNSSLPAQINKGYFVQEFELFDSNLRELLQQFNQDNKDPEENLKEILAIQILDAVNLLHQRHVLHGPIKASDFLISSRRQDPPFLKLLINPFPIYPSANLFQSSANELAQNSSDLPDSAEQQDLVSLGQIFLQLDTISANNSEDFSDNSTIPKLNRRKIFENQEAATKNSSSFLYKMARIFLSKQANCKLNSSARSMLLQLLKKNEEYLKIPIFSVVLRSQIQSSLDLSIIPAIIKQQQLIRTAKENQVIRLIDQFNAIESEEQHLSADLLKSALLIMLEWRNFEGEFDLLGVGSSGVVFGVDNLKEQRKSVLKLSLCTNKAETIREIEIMRICQSPSIVKFYESKFFEDANHNLFVVFELERCKYSLKNHLELQTIQDEYSEEQKYLLALQIISSVYILHTHKIIHRNIQLKSFLITENNEGEVFAKLSKFSHADTLQECFQEYSELENQTFQGEFYSPFNCIIQKYKRESLLYFAPERFNYPYPTTFQTDSFAVGLCLILIDNYRTFSEAGLANHLNSQTKPYSSICLDKDLLINRSTELHQIAKQFLSYLPLQRKSIKEFIDKVPQSSRLFSKFSYNTFQVTLLQQKNFLNISNLRELFTSSSKLLSPLINIQCLSINLENFFGFDEESLLSSFSNLPNLSSISLNLNDNQLKGRESLLAPLTNLTNLSKIKINLICNSIRDIGAQSLFKPLVNLLSLSSLSVNLESNKVEEVGPKFILQPLSGLINLQSLSFNLCNNSIEEVEGLSMLAPLSNLTNLSSLSVELSYNSINDIGAKNLLKPLADLRNLQSFSLNLHDNQIETIGASSLLKPLANLINLSSIQLDLHDNKIESIQQESCLFPLTHLINLQSLSLNLSGNSIGDTGAKYLLSPLSNLVNLASISLDLSKNSIGETGAQFLLSPIRKLLKLTSLSVRLFKNSIGSIGAQSLLQPLRELINLKYLTLNLDKNTIDDFGALSLLLPLQNLIKLSNLSLQLDRNSILEDGAQSLLKPLEKLVNLSSLSLNLCGNSINAVGATFLLSPLANLRNLQNISLDISGNSIGDIGAKSLLSTFPNLIRLQSLSLDLEGNSIGDIGGASLLTPLSNLVNLTCLSLRLLNNYIRCSGAQSLLQPLSNLANLSSFSLILENNSISNIGAKSLLSPIANLINITSLTLKLSQTSIGDLGAQSLIFPISNLSNLQSLTLFQDNDFKFKKTDHIYEQYLKQLKEINISD